MVLSVFLYSITAVSDALLEFDGNMGGAVTRFVVVFGAVSRTLTEVIFPHLDPCDAYRPIVYLSVPSSHVLVRVGRGDAQVIITWRQVWRS